MGFYTNITISNDLWHQIAKDPKALVDAITIGMNEGIEGPIHQTFLERGQAYHHAKRAIPQGVTVHKAEHADTPQVICCLPGTRAMAAHELPLAISEGWLDGGRYRAQTAQQVADQLRDLAREIENAIRRRSRAGESARCSRCRAVKGLHALGESCNNNCGGTVIRT